MSAALWLAWKELAVRRGRLVFSAGVVAAAVALSAATELVSRAREEAVAAQLDQIGPALQIVPEGVTGSALARHQLGNRMLPPGIVAALRGFDGIRIAEARLVIDGQVADRPAPVVGLSSGGRSGLGKLEPGEVALGSALAERSGARVGESVLVGQERYRVASIVPSTAGADDLAAYLPLEVLQKAIGAPGALNEVRLQVRPPTSPQAAEASIRAALAGVQVVRPERGEAADGGVQGSLERYRRLVYLVTAAVAGACLLIAAHLDASERRVEMATLVAIGGSAWTVLRAITARSAMVGAIGAVAGFAVGTAAAWLLTSEAATVFTAGSRLLLPALGLAALLGALAASPAALAAAWSDPTGDLQEAP